MTRILLVEDNAVIARLAAESLTKASYEVMRADCARAAIKLLTLHAFDVALVDLGLPDFDGAVVARWLRRQEEQWGRRRTIVIVSSASELEPDHPARLDADALLQKPLAVDSLAAIVAHHRRGQAGAAP